MSEQVEKAIAETPSVQAKTETEAVQVEAKETETPKDVISISQSELDRIKGEAVFKALENQKKKLEQERLKEKGEYEQLSNQLAEELNAIKAEKEKAKFQADVLKYAAEKNLTDYAEVLVSLPSMKEVKSLVEKLDSNIQTIVDQRVNERLSNPAPVHGALKTFNKKPADMSTEEFIEYKKQHRL